VTDEEFLEEYRQGLRETLDGLSGAKKRERELWVCETFLRNLGTVYDQSEVRSVDDESPDVLFRDARFEIKERLDPNRRRTDEYRRALEQAEQMTERNQIFTFFEPTDLTPNEIFANILPNLEGWRHHYEPRFRATLDLLVYYNAIGSFFKDVPELPDASAVAAYGFRSVSATTGSRAWVLWASDAAPALLADNRGLIRRGT